MTHDGPVAVAVVSSRVAAELIVGFLRSNDVHAVAVADDAGGQEPQLQQDGVRVLVARADEALARELLADADADAGVDASRPADGRA